MTGAGVRGDGEHGYQLPPSALHLNAEEVAGGADHLVARRGDQVFAWGSGWAGQLGQGSADSAAVPVTAVFEAR
jgi:alpha-tubulin suppressor-like RCC1 family protein